MLKVEFIGGEEVLKKIEQIEPQIQKSLLATITKLSFQLQAKVVSEKLSGQVLKTKTGTLRRSIATNVASLSGSITGRVGTNVDYGFIHEYGFKGNVTVDSHLRQITKAWGRSITPKKVFVRTHQKKANYPVRSFLRSALREMEPMIKIEIDKAIRL